MVAATIPCARLPTDMCSTGAAAAPVCWFADTLCCCCCTRAPSFLPCCDRYGGWEQTPPACPANYPTFAPAGICGHISFVELDGQMVYKQALAYLATKDLRYAQNAFAIVNAWANVNKAWGVSSENGPLEAGWGIASMARSLEMLRGVSGFSAVRDKFVAWFNTYLKPQMVNYVDVSTANAVKAGNLNIYGNWQVC